MMLDNVEQLCLLPANAPDNVDKFFGLPGNMPNNVSGVFSLLKKRLTGVKPPPCLVFMDFRPENANWLERLTTSIASPLLVEKSISAVGSG